MDEAFQWKAESLYPARTPSQQNRSQPGVPGCQFSCAKYYILGIIMRCNASGATASEMTMGVWCMYWRTESAQVSP
jgi:hypothetical protein